jgi:hypothetical protein
MDGRRIDRPDGKATDRRRIDLSATQVIASVLAALTGAVAASFLGVAGTVIGTAVMSVASTAVAAIYRHYLARSRERLQAAAEAARITPLVGGGAVAAFRGRQRATGSSRTWPRTTGERRTVEDGRATDEFRATDKHRARGADADQTEVFPAVDSQQRRWREADRADGFAARPGDAATIDGRQADVASAAGGGLADDIPTISGRRSGDDAATVSGNRADDAATVSSTRPGGLADVAAGARGDGQTSRDGTSGDGSGDGTSRDGTGTGRPPGAHARKDPDPGWRPRPLMLAGVALGIFLLVMAGITIVEVVAGKPLDAIVGGKSGSGTTISSIVGGSSNKSSHRTRPTGPAVSPHATTTPGASNSPSPTPSPTSSPSPSQSAAPNPSPSADGASPDPLPSTHPSDGPASGSP